jgi:hypothetical protein
MSRTVCQSVGKVFGKTAHHVLTKAGESRLTFGYENERPIFGSWQGATKLVVSWTLISSILQKIHQNEMRGAIFNSPDRQRKIEQSTIGFVDDNNNCVTGRKGSRIEEQLRESAQKWEKLLHTSGGRLELNKCFTFQIKWEQDNQGELKMKEFQEKIELKDSEEGEIFHMIFILLLAAVLIIR